VVVTLSVPVKANSGVRARIHAAGKVLEGDDQPTLLREDQHYLHYITIWVPGFAIAGFYRSFAIPVAKPTTLKHCE